MMGGETGRSGFHFLFCSVQNGSALFKMAQPRKVWMQWPVYKRKWLLSMGCPCKPCGFYKRDCSPPLPSPPAIDQRVKNPVSSSCHWSWTPCKPCIPHERLSAADLTTLSVHFVLLIVFLAFLSNLGMGTSPWFESTFKRYGNVQIKRLELWSAVTTSKPRINHCIWGPSTASTYWVMNLSEMWSPAKQVYNIYIYR